MYVFSISEHDDRVRSQQFGENASSRRSMTSNILEAYSKVFVICSDAQVYYMVNIICHNLMYFKYST